MSRKAHDATKPGRLLVFSGAGLSVASGLPTFRGAGGLWNGHKVEEVCNIITFKKNRAMVHEFYNARRADLRLAEPNDAHRAIAEWARRYETINITTNVDDLLERGGCTDVIHVHGSLTRMQCLACGGEWECGYEPWPVDGRCRAGRRNCTSFQAVKPAVVFFHEGAPRYADMYRAIRGLRPADVVLVIGSSSQVVVIDAELAPYPGHKVWVNPDRPTIMQDTYDEALLTGAVEAIPRIDAILRERLGEGRPG